MRRVRTLRRRRIRPWLDALGERVGSLWTEPARLSVAGQLRRLSSSLEGSIAAAMKMATAEQRLSRELERLHDLSRLPGRDSVAAPPPRRQVVPGSMPAALLLAATALALVAGNSWVLDRYLIPPALESEALRMLVVSGPWLAIPFSILALVLGLFHFALFTSGRTLPLRLLGALAVLLLIAQGALQAAATIVALETWTGAATTSWAGIGALILVAGAAGLVPAVIGATAHASLDRMSRWSAAREQRSAGRAGFARDRLAQRLERSLHQLTASVAALRAESAAIPEGDVARLLVRPDPPPSVERLAAVLDRLALAVDRDQAARTAPSTVAFRYVTDLGALTLWVLTAAAALLIGGPATGALAAGMTAAAGAAGAAGAAAGAAGTAAAGAAEAVAGAEIAASGGLPGAAILSVLLALLVSGLLLRLALDRPGRRVDSRVAGPVIVVLGVTIASLAMALGGAASLADPARFDPLGAAALLNVLVLGAAVASARLPEAIRTAASVVKLTGAAIAWLALAVSDAALALSDLVLTGPRRSRPRRHPRRSGAPPRRPTVATLGPGPGGR